MSEKLKIKINIIFVLVVLFNFNAVNFLKAEDNNFLTKDTLPLTLMQCIELTLTNNPEIIVSKINVAIQEQQIIKRDAEFMPSFQLGVYNSENNQVSITEVQSKSESAYSTAKLNTKIKTGADIALSHTLKKNEASSAAVNPSYSNDLSFSFNQPLLKNFGVKSTTAFLKIEKNNKLISRENLRKKVIDILSELQKNYWDLIYAIETYNVQRQSLEISEKLYRDNIKRVELGALAQIEITRAAAGAAEQTEKIIASENNIYSQRDLLLSKMNLINNSTYKNKLIIPLNLPEPLLEIPNIDKSLELAFSKNPEFLALQTDFENLGLRVEYYKNQKLPSLDLQSSAGFSNIKDEISKGYDNLAKSENFSWNIGLVFAVPLGNKTNKANLQIEQYNLEKMKLSLKQLENKIVTDVGIRIRNIQSTIKQIKAAEYSVKLAEENYNAELKRFELNQSTTYDVLKYQEALASAKIRLLKAIIDNRKAWIDYEGITGVLLENNNLIF